MSSYNEIYTWKGIKNKDLKMDDVQIRPVIKSSVLVFVVLSWIISFITIWGVYRYYDDIECDLKRHEVAYFRYLSEIDQERCD